MLICITKKKGGGKSLAKVRKLQKNPSVCSPSIRDAQQSGLCLPRAAMKDSSYKKNAALHSDFTCSFTIMFRYWLWSWKDRAPEEYVAVLLKIRVIPTEKPLFRQLCWAACYTHKISQPLRITRSSQNNHCFTICWTHYEQGSPRHNRDAAR